MKIDEAELLTIVPHSIAKDKTVQDVAKSLDAPINEVTGNIRNILILSRIDELPEEILDALAWEYHVDTYLVEYTLAQKRECIREAIKQHRYKGTPYAIKTALSVIADAGIEEWYQYDAKPYHFRVNMTRLTKSAAEFRQIDSICKETKNVRSWCDGVNCDIAVNWPLFIGGAKQIKTAITIYPKSEGGETLGGFLYTAIVGKYGEDAEIYKNS